MANVTKLSVMEYGKSSELSQLTEGDCLKGDAMRLLPIKNLDCIINEVNKLTTHFQDVDKDAFFRKYGRLMEIAKVDILSPAVRALVHFWDPDYRCFSFGSIDLCPTMEEYGMLTEFSNDLYRIYFPLRSDKVIPELSKLLRIPNLERSLEKKAAGLRWKMLESELEQKSGSEKERLIALGIFGLVLFPSRTGIISLEAAAAYVEYENTQINPVASVLAETIMTLNHCRKAGKGAVRCCTQLLYIWMVSHVETKKPVFNNFWWFNQKPLRIVEEEEWGDLDNQGWVEKLKAIPSGGLKWKAPWAKAVNVLMSCGQRCWVPLVGITGYVSYAPALVVRQHGGMQFVPRTKGIAQFFGLFKDPIAQEVVRAIKQDWKHLILLEIKGLGNPSTSEGYAKWRDLVASASTNGEVKPPQTGEKSVKRKRADSEGELKRQIEKLQMELNKTRRDKMIMEEMVLEGDKRRVFLDEQLQSRDARLTKLELKMVEEENVRVGIEKELVEMNRKWMQSCSELGALKTEHNECRDNIEYYQEKFAEVQCELRDRIEKYEELYKKYVMSESRLVEPVKDEGIKAELVIKEDEIRTLKTKLDKEREKMKHMDEKLALIEKHKDQIDANNTSLNRTNMLLIEKLSKMDEQMDEAAAHARVIRINARNVGRDIIRYQRNLAETDAFLESIENRGFAFLPLAKDMADEGF